MEVSVRNSLHVVFSTDLKIEDWYHNGQRLPWPLPTAQNLILTSAMQKMITEARFKAGGAATVGKVIAELPFGFWTLLIGNRFDDIWRRSLYKAFPHARKRRRLSTGG